MDKIRKTFGKYKINSLFRYVARKINGCFIYFFRRTGTINDKLICLESDGDLSDNAYALFDYIESDEKYKQFEIVWFVNNVGRAKKRLEKFDNVVVIKKMPLFLNIKWAKYLSTCKWFIYDHINLLSTYRKDKKQSIIYLSHGWGYKAAKNSSYAKELNTFDLLTATGTLSARGLAAYWNCPLKKIVITGYPRCDYFFKEDTTIDSIIEKKFKLKSYRKVIFWMPTFRKSILRGLSEDYITNETGLPIFYNEEDLKKFSHFLCLNNIVFIFKLHHLQAELPVFKRQFKNVIIIRDEDLYNLNIQLYQFISYADAMISDYSSVSIDYLLLDRPIIFTLDDYEQYDKSRGLFPKNAIDYMPGYHVYNQKELQDAILEISDGIDKYSQERAKVIDQYHTYKDGNSSKRVLDAIGIKI